MVKFEIYKEYPLKLGQAYAIPSIYLGIKRSQRKKAKHVFLVYTWVCRSFKDFRFYLGDLNKTTFEEEIVRIKDPQPKWINKLESELIKDHLNKLKNQ